MKTMPKPPYQRILFVCCNERPEGQAACGNRGSAALHQQIKDYMKSKSLKARVRISRALCFGLCEIGPNLCVFPENVWYHGVTEADLGEIKKLYIDPMVDAPPSKKA